VGCSSGADGVIGVLDIEKNEILPNFTRYGELGGHPEGFSILPDYFGTGLGALVVTVPVRDGSAVGAVYLFSWPIRTSVSNYSFPIPISGSPTSGPVALDYLGNGIFVFPFRGAVGGSVLKIVRFSTGDVLASAPLVDASDDVWFNSADGLIYVTGDNIQVFNTTSSNGQWTLRLVGNIYASPTGTTKTSIFLPALDILAVTENVAASAGPDHLFLYGTTSSLSCWRTH